MGWPRAQPSGRTAQELMTGVPPLRFESCLQCFLSTAGSEAGQCERQSELFRAGSGAVSCFPWGWTHPPRELPGRMEMFFC